MAVNPRLLNKQISTSPYLWVVKKMLLVGGRFTPNYEIRNINHSFFVGRGKMLLDFKSLNNNTSTFPCVLGRGKMLLDFKLLNNNMSTFPYVLGRGEMLIDRGGR
jgi:hypothetical protein